MLYSPQIPLPLGSTPESRFDNFVAGCNQARVDAIRHFPDDNAPVLYLSGEESCGKTHLLNALCREERDQGRTAFYLGLGQSSAASTEMLQGLSGIDLVCLDDCDNVVGDIDREEAIFHVFNRLRAGGGKLVVSARRSLRKLDFKLPDLRSRLGSGLQIKLGPLEESDKEQVLRWRARALDLDVPDEVINYLLRRSRRHLADLLNVLDQLQRAAFTAKRRVTIPLVREILKR
jgi:DnaA family protein